MRNEGTSDARTYHIAVIMGIITGLLLLLVGFVLCLLGFTGTIQFFVKSDGFQARLLNASPGVFFALLGTVIMWKYKPKITYTERKRKTKQTYNSESDSFTNEIDDQYRSGRKCHPVRRN